MSNEMDDKSFTLNNVNNPPITYPEFVSPHKVSAERFRNDGIKIPGIPVQFP